MSKWIAVTVAETRGSCPREPGATMRVWPDRIEGTIGGGALEWEAIRAARAMLVDGTQKTRQTVTLGPDMGQCCGGVMVLDFSADGRADGPTGARADGPTGAPIYIWGAGHVGRALVSVLAPFEGLNLVWLDEGAARFPDHIPANVAQKIAPDMVAAAAEAPNDAHHYILTYSHALDLALCDALLARGFAFAGLIGSDTKWARFRSRLEQMGHERAAIERITCPIGEKALGKAPQAIAVGVAHGLLMTVAKKEAVETSDSVAGG